MQRIIIISLSLFCIAISSVFAQTPKRIACVQAGLHDATTQCAYEVVGQKINDPESVSKLYGMSGMPYALCSSAKCTVNKRKPNLASCDCKVFSIDDKEAAWRKASVGPFPYAKSKAVKHKNTLISVTSNFSFANIDNLGQMKSRDCQFEQATAWANCFGVRCQVNKTQDVNHVTATCHCPIVKTKAFISMGPTDVTQCTLPEGQAWSAASTTQGDNDFAVIQDMYKQYYPDAPVAKQ